MTKTRLPWGTRLVNGEVLSTKTRADMAATRERRRKKMYAILALNPADVAEPSAADLIGRVAAAKSSAADSPQVTRMRRAVRKAERVGGDGSEHGGTGQTVIKSRFSPLARLISDKRIGHEELEAADEIVKVFMATSGGLLARSPAGALDRVSGRVVRDSNAMLDATRRYRAWANRWSNRAKRGDPTLAIVIAAIVDEHPFRAIEQDRGLRHGRAADAVVNGLRDYAASAGWVTHRIAADWRSKAEALFRLRKVA